MKKGSASRNPNGPAGRLRVLRKWAFFLVVLAVYGVLATVEPVLTLEALRQSIRVLLQIALPITLALAMMFVINLTFQGPQVARLLSKGAGLKGVLLSSVAGMLSMGPVYAWYPLLRDLRKQGASDFHIANFLCCRSVKPILLPVMIYYFGWVFSLVLNLLIVLGALLVAFLTDVATQLKETSLQ